MINFRAQEISNAVAGDIIYGDNNATAKKVSTDSRNIDTETIFIALKGERFDANDFIQQAVDAHASVIIGERFDLADKGKSTCILVEDSLLALQRLASYMRAKMDIVITAVTGSNGKTSTKDFIKQILSNSFKTSATLGNFNNHIGLPLTILSCDGDEDAAVWEMGMNHSGEIAPLCDIAMPKYGVITNIGTAHIEFLGSEEAIAKEKGALAEALPEEGVLILPMCCKYNDYFTSVTKAKVHIIGAEDSIVRAKNLVMNEKGSTFDLYIDGQTAEVLLPVVGEHMVKNALLAAAVGMLYNIPVSNIASALSQSVLTKGRLHIFDAKGVKVIDDTYNANPESMQAALQTLSEMPIKDGGKKIAVLGKLGELGIHEARAYETIGKLANSLGIFLISVGDQAKLMSEQAPDKSMHFSINLAASKWLKLNTKPGDVVLFKGSRAAAVENIINNTYKDLN